MTLWLQELRLALRSLARTPSVSAVAVIAMALAIGATTTVFSVVKGVLLDPLPFDEPDRLVTVFQYDPASPEVWRTASQGSFVDLRDDTRSFEAVEAGRNRSFTLTSFEDGDTPLMREVSHGYFTLLGVEPVLGRTFRADEDRPGGARVLVLSYELWQRRFGGDPQVVGRTTELDGEPFEIVGVMPQGYTNIVWGLDVPPQAWLPLALPESDLDRRGNAHLVFARLGAGVDLKAAQAEIDTLADRLREAYPDAHRDVEFIVTPAKEPVVRSARPMLLVLFGAVVFVVLVACGNVANLLLARAMARRREMAVRRALGASLPRLLRQLLTESVALAVAGGALGSLLAVWGVRAVQTLMPASPGAPRFQFDIDLPVLAFTALVSLLTGVVFGLAPVYHAGRESLESDLSVAATRATGGAGRQRLRGALVVGEVALCLVLLVGAGLMLRSFMELRGLDPGFETDRMLTFRVSTRGPAYAEAAARAAFFESVVDEVGRIPGVRSAGLAQFNPMFSQFFQFPVRVDSEPMPEPGAEPRVALRRTLPGFLETLGVPLLRGRHLDRRDSADAPRVAVINATLARQLFAERDPLLESLTVVDGDDVSWRIVGVVGDVRSSATPPVPEPTLFVPLAQDPEPTSALVVARTQGDPLSYVPQAEAAVRTVDRGMPVYLVQTMRDVVENMDASVGLVSKLLAAFAFLALVLAATGMYGVLSYLVSQRTREFGIRMALGARPGSVVGLVLRSALGLGLLGVGIGVAGALALSRVLESQLFGVSATDPGVYAGLSLLLVALVIASSAVPAARALRVDPAVTLREE